MIMYENCVLLKTKKQKKTASSWSSLIRTVQYCTSSHAHAVEVHYRGTVSATELPPFHSTRVMYLYMPVFLYWSVCVRGAEFIWL